MRLVEESALTAEAWNPESDYLLNVASGATVTLPAASGTGHKFRFMCGKTVTSNANIIQVASADDIIQGSIVGSSDNAADAAISWEGAADSDTMTFNGTTKGGYIGDSIELTDIANGVWLVTGIIQQTGTEVTPFSAAV